MSAMSSRRWLAYGSGVLVFLSALDSALINELPRGWAWWIAAGTVVLAAVALTIWMALVPGDRTAERRGAGSVTAGADIEGDVETHTVVPSRTAAGKPGDGAGAGSVVAGRHIRGSVRTTNVIGPRSGPPA